MIFLVVVIAVHLAILVAVSITFCHGHDGIGAVVGDGVGKVVRVVAEGLPLLLRYFGDVT